MKYVEAMINTLRSLSESKDYIYSSEKRLEEREESISPITKQITKSTLPKIDPHQDKGVFSLNIQPMSLRDNSVTKPFENEEDGVND